MITILSLGGRLEPPQGDRAGAPAGSGQTAAQGDVESVVGCEIRFSDETDGHVWELRVGEMRVFYDVEVTPKTIVIITAVGIKERDRILIAGKVIEP